jgi:replicative DNA helicase
MYERIEAEESLIGCLLTDGNSIEKVYGILSPEMFESEIYGRVYYEYRNAFDEHKELTITELQQNLESAGIRAYEVDDALRRAAGTNALPFQIVGHATAIQNHYKSTCVSAILNRANIKDADIDSQIDRLISDLEGLRSGESSDAQTVSEIADKYKDAYFIDRNKPSAKLNVEDLDGMIGGFEGGDLVIIGARPAVGKSALVTQWAEMFANIGLKVGFYNLEMTDKQMFERFVAAKSGIEITRIRMATRFLNNEEERYKYAVEELKKQERLYISTGAKKVSDIRADMRRMDYDLLIIDYLQLLIADARYQGNRAAEVGEISRQLKAIAIDYNIPVIALSQLNRLSEGRQNKEPTMGELREAGNLEQDASVIILMWNKNEDNRSEKGLKVEKSRQGKTGRCDMIFDGAHMRFVPENAKTPFDEVME